MDHADQKIEQQMTVLLRRVQRIHLYTTSGEVHLERSAYSLLCQLADQGPQRLGALAAAFGLDPSTITRQVHALESAGLTGRSEDPSDRRAAIVDLTEEGREALHRTREYRRRRLEEITSAWSDTDRSDFGRLLEQFNTAVDALLEQG